MNHQEIMAVMAEVYNRLYCTSFRGEQAMVVVDCERILLQAMQKMNEEGARGAEKTPAVPRPDA